MTRRAVLAGFLDRLAQRERWLVLCAGALVLVALVWGLGVAPAIKSLRSAPAQLKVLDAQYQTMENLATQARALQSRPAVSREDALRTLQSALQQHLGASAQLGVAADRATITLKGASPEGLVQWLGVARSGARVVVRQATLARGPNGWDGTIMLDLPAPA